MLSPCDSSVLALAIGNGPLRVHGTERGGWEKPHSDKRDLVADCCHKIIQQTAQSSLRDDLINLPLFNAIVIIPVALLLIAWSESNRKPIEYFILTLSAVLLNAASIRSVKLSLLGMDYSSRLHTTIAVNMIAAFALGVHLGIKRRWIATVAALILLFAWLLIAAVNAAV